TLLRLGKGLEERACDPPVALIGFAPDHDGMHDGKYAGLAEIVLFDLAVVFEQAPDLAAAGCKGRRHARRVQRIDLAVREHGRERLCRAIRLDPDGGRKRESDLLGAPRLLQASGAVGDAVDRHGIVLGENSAYPDRRSHLVLGRPYPLAFEVAWRANAGVDVHVDARMPEKARWKD